MSRAIKKQVYKADFIVRDVVKNKCMLMSFMMIYYELV